MRAGGIFQETPTIDLQILSAEVIVRIGTSHKMHRRHKKTYRE
jgi:hypothetical protein